MNKYIDVDEESGRKFFMEFQGKGKVTMLNLLKFKAVADYTNFESLKPDKELSGKEAYKLYTKHTLPILQKAGGQVLFYGSSNSFLIGPSDIKWDTVLLVEHESVEKFISFAKNEEYLKTIGHRTAALEDSRLLPITENKPKEGNS